ncbi:MAG: NosD domain-containing protein [Candidatus Heimdallarchaeaceae archaeon]
MFISNKKKVSTVILGLMLVCTLTMTKQNTLAEINHTSYLKISLTDSFPILIDSNDDFIALSFPGNGSSSNPYIIEDLRVVSTGQLDSAIVIGGTDVHFVIQNCEIVSNYLGVYIQPTVAIGTAKIINNTITCSTTNGGGIGIGADQVLVENNTISGFMQGIHVNEADDTTIKANHILLSYYQGINIRYSSFNIITDNNIRNSNQHGLAIVGGTSTYNIIYNNIFANNSNKPTYVIDGGVVTGDTGSQGYDGGSNNQWYNALPQQGNRWDDYDGEGTYSIDGSAESVDQYPQKYITATDESSLLLIVSIISIIGLTILFFKRN